MQSDVDEVRGHVLVLRPLAAGIRDHQRYAVFAQGGDKRRIDETVVPDLHGMAQRPLWAEIHFGASGNLVVMRARQRARLVGVARQGLEEVPKQRFIVAKKWRQLPEHRPKLFAKVREPGSEEVRQRRICIAQTQHMRNEFRCLDAEYKAVGRIGVPVRVTRRSLQGIERAVELDRRKRARGELEFAPLWQVAWIEHAAPRLVAPTGNADADGP